jgi:hypothetical protein
MLDRTPRVLAVEYDKNELTKGAAPTTRNKRNDGDGACNMGIVVRSKNFRPWSPISSSPQAH